MCLKVSCLKIDLFCYFEYFYQITKKNNPKTSQAFINQQYEIKISQILEWCTEFSEIKLIKLLPLK